MWWRGALTRKKKRAEDGEAHVGGIESVSMLIALI